MCVWVIFTACNGSPVLVALILYVCDLRFFGVFACVIVASLDIFFCSPLTDIAGAWLVVTGFFSVFGQLFSLNAVGALVQVSFAI